KQRFGPDSFVACSFSLPSSMLAGENRRIMIQRLHTTPISTLMHAKMPPIPPSQRGRGVTAVLGPTNTGKTHLAIERMLAHASGVIGLPLRLLAREVYNRCVERVGADAVALITGEEKIKPPKARF